MIDIEDKIELLKKIAHKFNEEKITWALGASMLLYFKGIANEFNDIDLMIVDEDIELVKTILSDMGELKESKLNPKYQTKVFLEYIIDSIDVDVMVGFSILNDDKLYDCSLKKQQIVEMMPLGEEFIPLQSPLLWKEYYQLMGRDKKVKMIDDFYRNKK